MIKIKNRHPIKPKTGYKLPIIFENPILLNREPMRITIMAEMKGSIENFFPYSTSVKTSAIRVEKIAPHTTKE